MADQSSDPGVGAAVVVEAAPVAAAAVSVDDVAGLLVVARDALVAAHPDAVPELIAGATVAELRASVEIARAVYARVVVAERARLAAQGSPAGAPARTLPVNVDALSASAKIAAGLRQGR